MAQAKKQKKLRALFEQSMPKGGLPEFRKNWEQSLGIVDDDNGRKKFNPEKREVDYKEFQIGATCEALMGPHWRECFEQRWQDASRLRFEGVGGMVLSGDLPYVSAAIDVIAGLANARALERPMAPQFIWNDFCSVNEITGEGGFDVIVRSAGDPPSADLAEGQSLPTSTLLGSRVHRNRTLSQGLRTKISKWTILDDLTGTLYAAIDENADQVLNERERKVADCVLGVSLTTGAANTFALTVSQGASIGSDNLAIPVNQDGLTFFPYQKGVYGAAAANAGAVIASPQNGKYIRNYGNCNFTDGVGLADYNTFVRALGVLVRNRDPFTGLPCNVDLSGMTILVSPAAEVQLKFLLSAEKLWQGGAVGIATASGTATVSSYNYARELAPQLRSSQLWMNRLSDVGVTTLAANGTYAHLTFNQTAGFTTAASVNSALYMGHYKRAVRYAQRTPYSVIQVPIGPQEFGEECVMIQDVRERGQAYWVDPRIVWRSWC
jgi:hypothetical protein